MEKVILSATDESKENFSRNRTISFHEIRKGAKYFYPQIINLATQVFKYLCLVMNYT